MGWVIRLSVRIDRQGPEVNVLIIDHVCIFPICLDNSPIVEVSISALLAEIILYLLIVASHCVLQNVPFRWPRLLFNSSVVGIQSLQPNLVSFNAAISACEAAGEWQVALCLLACITVSSHKADLLTYNSLISALGRGEQWQLALLFLHGFLPQAGLTPDVFSFTAAISAMEKAANGDQALALLACAKRILPEGPNMVLYSAVISACEKSKQWPEALALLFEAREEALQNIFGCIQFSPQCM